MSALYDNIVFAVLSHVFTAVFISRSLNATEFQHLVPIDSAMMMARSSILGSYLMDISHSTELQSMQLAIRRTRLSTVGDRAFPVAGCHL